jgi:hypothetical protein
MTVEDIQEIAAAANCVHQDAVKWNPYNHCVQCHGCGVIFGPWDYTTPLPESIAPIAPRVPGEE